jgi:Ca2+-binding EF-hand superfamily protein
MRTCTFTRMATIVALLSLAAAGPATAQAVGDAAAKIFDRILAKMDKDGDGALSAAEGEALAERMFERRDANGDAVLTRDEFMASKGGGRLSADQQAKLEAFRAERFAAMDKNGDGQVGAEEYFAAAQGRFDAADADRDGRVTKEEMSTLRGAL